MMSDWSRIDRNKNLEGRSSSKESKSSVDHERRIREQADEYRISRLDNIQNERQKLEEIEELKFKIEIKNITEYLKNIKEVAKKYEPIYQGSTSNTARNITDHIENISSIISSIEKFREEHMYQGREFRNWKNEAVEARKAIEQAEKLFRNEYANVKRMAEVGYHQEALNEILLGVNERLAKTNEAFTKLSNKLGEKLKEAGKLKKSLEASKGVSSQHFEVSSSGQREQTSNDVSRGKLSKGQGGDVNWAELVSFLSQQQQSGREVSRGKLPEGQAKDVSFRDWAEQTSTSRPQRQRRNEELRRKQHETQEWLRQHGKMLFDPEQPRQRRNEVSQGEWPEDQKQHLYYSYCDSKKELRQLPKKLNELIGGCRNSSLRPQIEVGQQLGDYRLVKKLGNGGFGNVFLGQHSASGELAAIKVPRGDLDRAGRIEKFCQEVENLARFNHPNIVRLRGFGRQGKVPFLVMEYMPGGTLKGRRMSPNWRLDNLR